MIRTKIAAVAMAATALAAAPLAATPAAAEENHPCEYLFTDPYAGICYIPIQVYCIVFPTQAICH
ncbi:MAG TPA: hypothetical protein VG318_09525 [Actinomycetota bacterium]|nr:hypothetical protein [Actinomycetota bacterium]